jgi:xanthine dehydrogenase YagS FAD-binding subunit
MQAFEYAAPHSTEEALALLSTKSGESAILAGGTDLLSLMKERIHTPKRLVSLKNLSELYGVGSEGDNLRIGAMATINDLLQNSQLRDRYPSLIQAAEGIGGDQMRSMGTVGGDILQRPRCWYFRNGFGLLGQDSTGKSLIPKGENKYHAILGNSGPAYFVNASSLAPALIALDATAKIASPEGERSLDLEKLYRTPSDTDERELSLKPNEILTGVIIPNANTANATYEVRERVLLDWPLAAAAVAIKMDGNSVRSARVVLGHVAPIPWQSSEAANALKGKSINAETAAAAGEAAVKDATPLSNNRHKVRLASVSVKRAILTAAGVEV